LTVDTVNCTTCGLPAVVGYPHRHETPVRPDYDPMPACPDTLDEMVALMRAGYQSEIPVQLHVSYVPGRAEPMAVSEYSSTAAGYVVTEQTIEAIDSGALGSPSWSPAFHRRAGGVTVWGDEWTLNTGDYQAFPWAYAIDVSLRNWCRSRHLTRPELYREHRHTTICHSLTRLVVAHRYPIDKAAEACEMTTERAAWLLQHVGAKGRQEGALRLVWRVVSERLNDIDLRRKAA
jgi:hypothetical protein